MTSRTKDFWRQLDAISASETLHDLREATRAAVSGAGFGAAFILIPITADPRVGREMTNLGFSEYWQETYEARLHLIDPLPAEAMTRDTMFRWSDSASRLDGNAEHREFWSEMERLGAGDGLSMVCFGPQARSGYAAVSLPSAKESFEAANIRKVSATMQLAFQRHCHLDNVEAATIPALSQRELEVIRWIGEGKSNAVIASILDISKSSVDIYVKRIFGKLGVHDRTTASVRALALGLISHEKTAPRHGALRRVLPQTREQA